MATTALNGVIWQLINHVTQVSSMLSIVDVALEHTPSGLLIRGFDATHGAPVLILHTTQEVSEIPFGSLAIPDCMAFNQKINLAKSQDENYQCSATVDATTKEISALHLRGKKFKLDINAGKISTVRAPKNSKDTIAYSFEIDSSTVDSISQGVRAMAAEEIMIISDGISLRCEIKSTAKDVLSMELCSSFKIAAQNASPSFVFRYPYKTIRPLLANNTSFSITSRGLITSTIMGITVFILPRI